MGATRTISLNLFRAGLATLAVITASMFAGSSVDAQLGGADVQIGSGDRMLSDQITLSLIHI